MPIPTEYTDIIAILAEKTSGGRVQWRNGNLGDIAVFFDGSRFSIWAGSDEQTDEPFVAFALQDDRGVTLDSWYVEQQEGSAYAEMHRLYTSAKRHAAGVPQMLRRLRDKLASRKNIGPDDEL